MTKTPSERLWPVAVVLVCYFFGVMALSFELLPEDAWAIFGVKPEHKDLGLSITVAAAAFLSGAILQFIFNKATRYTVNTRTVGQTGAAMLLVSGLLWGSSIVVSRWTAISPRQLETGFRVVGYAVVGTFVMLLFLGFAFLFVFIRYHRVNRMSRMLQAGDALAAIRLGEAVPEKDRHFGVSANLVSAYLMAGQADKAKELFVRLERIDRVPKHYTEDSYKQTMEFLRRLLSGVTAVAPATPQDFGQRPERSDMQD